MQTLYTKLAQQAHPVDEHRIDGLTQKVSSIFGKLVDLKGNPAAQQVLGEITQITSEVESLRYEMATLKGNVQGHAATQQPIASPQI
jgi:hypothetical protein